MKDIIRTNIENLKKETLSYYSKEVYKELEMAIEKDNNFKNPINLISTPFEEFQSKLDESTKFHNRRYKELIDLLLSWREKMKRKLKTELEKDYPEDLPLEAKEGFIWTRLAEFDVHFNIK